MSSRALAMRMRGREKMRRARGMRNSFTIPILLQGVPHAPAPAYPDLFFQAGDGFPGLLHQGQESIIALVGGFCPLLKHDDAALPIFGGQDFGNRKAGQGRNNHGGYEKKYAPGYSKPVSVSVSHPFIVLQIFGNQELSVVSIIGEASIESNSSRTDSTPTFPILMLMPFCFLMKPTASNISFRESLSPGLRTEPADLHWGQGIFSTEVTGFPSESSVFEVRSISPQPSQRGQQMSMDLASSTTPLLTSGIPDAIVSIPLSVL